VQICKYEIYPHSLNYYYVIINTFKSQDKYMRALAENQNTLNRMRKQVDDAKVYGVQNLVKDLLDVCYTLHLP